MKAFTAVIFFIAIAISAGTRAEDKIELKTTVIKGNTELPKILYVVPWQDAEAGTSGTHKLTLHSLFGDLFDPVTPTKPPLNTSNKQLPQPTRYSP